MAKSIQLANLNSFINKVPIIDSHQTNSFSFLLETPSMFKLRFNNKTIQRGENI